MRVLAAMSKPVSFCEEANEPTFQKEQVESACCSFEDLSPNAFTLLAVTTATYMR